MRLEEKQFLYNKTLMQFTNKFPYGASFEEFTDSIISGDIIVELTKKETSSTIDENCLEKIDKTLPSIFRIVDKPRSFIKSHEEKVPVETAKRINSKAISTLSRDSNDWRARTFLSVKPKNIVSDVNEETIDLYENRFIRTLIDRSLKLVVKRRQRLQSLYEQYGRDSASEAVNNYNRNKSGIVSIRYQDKSNSLMKRLSRSSESMKKNELEDLEKKLNDTKCVENKLRIIKRTDFYKKLRTTKKVNNPIKRTNIILFDQNYQAAYKLWITLNLNVHDEDISFDTASDKEIQKVYEFYSFEMILASLYDMGFHETSKYKFGIDNRYQIFCEGCLIFEKDDYVLKLDIDDNHEIIYVPKDRDRDLWRKVIIYPEYVDFENKNRIEIERITDGIIENIIPRNKKRKTTEYIAAGFAFVSLDVHICSENNDFGEKLYRRLFNIGDNYSDKETNIDAISGYKTGIIIVSPQDAKLNLLRIERLLYSKLLNIELDSFNFKACPLCGDSNIQNLGENDYRCYSCSHKISISTCNHCGKDMLWIKYKDDEAIRQAAVTKGLDKKPYYFQLMHYEAVMGQYAITSFTLEKEITGWKLKSLCPYCGKKLGD